MTAVFQERRLQVLIALATVLLGALLLFSRLGHYALWDDEAMDALSARGVVSTGDTTAVLGENIVAYRNGLLLVNLRHQGMPPLPAYAVAVSFRVFGESAWSARLPFAICGLFCVTLLAWWGFQLGLSRVMQAVLGMAILGNVSLLLYFRNCHYYGFGIFFGAAITYLYLTALQRPVCQWLAALVSGLLMTANYTWFVALYICLFADYMIWRRRKDQLSISSLMRILLPQIPFGLILLAWWNPLGTKLGGYLQSNTVVQKLQLFLWNWRDLNACEFISVGILLAAFWFALRDSDLWLRRALFALGLYVILVTVLSTQIIGETEVADIRYLAGALPLCIAISALTFRRISLRVPGWALGLAVLAFGTNIFNGGPLLAWGARSTIVAFIGELVSPPSDPYTPAAKWIRENVLAGQSIWVVPDYMNYPLIFHAPHAVYAWQLDKRGDQQFAALDSIHFRGEVLPDYIVVFGPSIVQIVGLVNSWRKRGVEYRHVATLETFWKDMYRPELFWRKFQPVQNFNLNSDVIYIMARQTPTRD